MASFPMAKRFELIRRRPPSASVSVRKSQLSSSIDFIQSASDPMTEGKNRGIFAKESEKSHTTPDYANQNRFGDGFSFWLQ
jgi:hypothetical protein